MRDTPWSLYFSSHFARHFIEKEKSRNGGKKKKEREENFREHGCVRANNFVAEFALVQ